MRAFQLIQNRLSGSSGFTLVEVLVALTIMGLSAGLIGSGLFQVMSLTGTWQDGVIATKDLRHAGSWFTRDALNARKALDGNGDPLICANSSPTVTLTWTGTQGTAHSAIYSVVGSTLQRNFDGNVNNLEKRVVANSLGFKLCGKLLTFDMKVDAETGNQDRIVLDTYLRRLD